MMRAFQIAALVAVIAFVSVPAEGAWLSPCAAEHVMDSWQRKGFWRTPKIYNPPVSRIGAKIRYLGAIRAGAHVYRIYFDLSDDPGYQHLHRDLVVEQDGRFLGFYDTDADPIGIAGPDVLFKARKEDGDRIHFGRNGPPKTAWIDGENPDLNTLTDPRSLPLTIPSEKQLRRAHSACRR